MAEISESAVRSVLETVIDPTTSKSIIALGMVSGIATRGGHVAVNLEVDPARGAALEPLRQACEQAVRAMPGVLSATAVMTAERAAAPAPKPPIPRRAVRRLLRFSNPGRHIRLTGETAAKAGRGTGEPS